MQTVTNEAGLVISRSNYDPFGQERILIPADLVEEEGDGEDAENSEGEIGSSVVAFTGHEQLAVNLTHMNGRVYDPVLGRFLSADPLIAERYDPQNLNRYSYVRNNPLGYVDRNGFTRKHPLEILEYFSYRQFQFFLRTNISFQDFRAVHIGLHALKPNVFTTRQISQLNQPYRPHLQPGGGTSPAQWSQGFIDSQARAYSILAQNGVSADQLHREIGQDFSGYTITSQAYGAYEQYQAYLKAKKRAKKFQIIKITVRVVAAALSGGLSETASFWLQTGLDAAITYAETGDLEAVAIGVATAYAFHAAGDFVDGNYVYRDDAGKVIGHADGFLATKVGLHGLIGGISAELRGGDFLGGFVTSAIPALVSGSGLLEDISNSDGIDGVITRTLAAGAIGGISATLVGGEFLDGFEIAGVGAFGEF